MKKNSTRTIAVILAAGISTRMNTKLPKVLHEVAGRPMLTYVLDACREAGIEKILVVVGYGKQDVQQAFADYPGITWVHQGEQKGTAHAVSCCKEHLVEFEGNTMVLCGDGPLIRSETLRKLEQAHIEGDSAVTLATAVLEDPEGYGRIARDKYGNFSGIVESPDCTAEQKAIKEVNPSYYIFDNKILFEALEKVKSDNAKGEYYLTDVPGVIISSGRKVRTVISVRPEEAKGINSREQLSEAGRVIQRRIQKKLMAAGVTIVDGDNTWIDAGVKIGQDTVIEPFTCIHGEVRIGAKCRIGPLVYICGGANCKNIEDETYIRAGTIISDETEEKTDIL